MIGIPRVPRVRFLQGRDYAHYARRNYRLCVMNGSYPDNLTAVRIYIWIYVPHLPYIHIVWSCRYGV